MAADKLMPEIHLRPLGFTWICELFTNSEEGILKFEETGDSRFI